MHEFPPPARPLAPPPHPLPATQSVTVLGSGADDLSGPLLDERIIMINGEIDETVAHRVTARLLLLAARDPRRDIVLYVHSSSGSATAGLAVLDVMRSVAPDVATCAVGVAGSVGQMLVTAGAAGKRTALPHARLLLRRASGDARPDVLDAQRRELAAVTATSTGRTIEQVVADSEVGRWFSAAQAVDHGLVDAVSSAPGD